MSELDYINGQLPYNPSDVDIRQQKFAVKSVMDMITDGDIELLSEEEFQRKGNQWTLKQKSRLIESLIMRIPLPIFYFDGSQRPWKVIDGLQRLTTLYLFQKGWSFELRDMEYMKELEGKVFFDIPFQFRRAIETATIEAYVINPGTPDKVRLNIFQRINSLGRTLNAQEIRNAYFREGPAEFIDSLSQDPEFLKTTGGKIKQTNMKDKEAVLRFFAFFKYLDRYTPPMTKFLDYSMESIYKISTSEQEEMKERFQKSMITCREIFGENAFYIIDSDGHKQTKAINLAIFESLSVNVAQLTIKERNKLSERGNRFLHFFSELFKDVEFYKSVLPSASGGKTAVMTRFEAVKQTIKETIQ